MTDPATPPANGAPPASTTPPASTPPGTPPPANTPPEGSTPPSDYKIPDAYKEKGWAKNIKSDDDVWKMLDNAQALAGKKTVAPDWEKATPQEIEEYYAQTRPTDKAAYQFDETVTPEQKTAYSDLLYKHGISAKQGNDLIKDYKAMEATELAKIYDKEGFNAELKKSFGDDFEKTGGETAKLIAANINADDKALLEKVPNMFLGLIYRVAANLNKAYGARESGAPANTPPGNTPSADIEVQANKLRDDISALSRRAHTAEEKQNLVNQLAALYKGK